MTDSLNDKFVAVLKQRIPTGHTVFSSLTEILSLGREAIYRRLRSEVPFTFEEVVKISLHYGISLDKLTDTDKVLNQGKWAIMDMDLLSTPSSYPEQYSYRMEKYAEIFQKMKQAKSAKVYCAANVMPYSLILPYDTLSRFHFYKWNYLTKGVLPDFSFSKMEKLTSTQEYEKQLLTGLRLSPRTLYIIDRNVFRAFVGDILYFYRLGLVSDSEFLQMKNELLDVVADVERITACGTNVAGKETTIYLSDMNLDATYVYIEYDQHAISIHRAYFIDSFNFHNERICTIQKEWIELLKRYSTPITQCFERQRFEYMDKQKELIEGMAV